jgi:methionine-S-sulfoxide reductase
MKTNVYVTVAVIVLNFVGQSWTIGAEIKPGRTAPGASTSPAKNPAAGEAAKPAAPAGKKTETAIFAGGCFWCTEFAFEQVDGVTNVESGYCGGTKSTATYDHVHLGTTGHAEAIRITYDPDKVTFDKLLDVFFDSHDPTQLNRQGEGDIGKQYRSAIFYANEDQQKQAKDKIADLEAKKVFKRHIVTKLEPLKEFYPAEDYHQDFARRNPFLPYIQSHAVPKAANVRNKHPDLIKKAE